MKDAPATCASPSPLIGKANLTAGPTPAKSPLANADDTQCIPDTPDEGSASKAVHASVHAAGVHDQPVAGLHSIAAPDAATAKADPAGPPSGVTTSVDPSSGHGAVSRARRMVPESPDEEGPLHASSQHVAFSQPQLCMPMPCQEAVLVVAPLVKQPASQSHSQSLHLSLGMHSSGEASCQPVDQTQHQAQPEAQPQAHAVGELSAVFHQSAVVMAAAALAADATFRQVAAVPLSAEAGIAVQSLGQAVAATRQSSLPDVSAVAPVQPASDEALDVGPATSRVAETARLQAPPALATAALTHREAEAAAAAAAATPSSSRQVPAQVVGSAGMSIGSPMNDSALMAALDSAERKFIQVLQTTVSSLSVLVQERCAALNRVLAIKRNTAV